MIFVNLATVVLSWMLLISVFGGVSGLFAWHIFGETGATQVLGRVQEEMSTAYEEGRYREVVSLYEARHHVRFRYDWSPAESHILGAPTVFRIAESYRAVGNAEAARLHYMALLGWSEWEYQSYCRLGSNDCPSDLGLRDLARIKTGTAR